MLTIARAHRDSIGCPLGNTPCAHPPRVDVVVRATMVLPGDDGPARAIGADGGSVMLPVARAHRHAIGGPLGATPPVHPPSVDVVVGATMVLPGNDGPAGPIRGNRLTILLPVARAHRHS